MSDVLIDADAFLWIRKLSLLNRLRDSRARLVMTEYVARHDLSDLGREIDEMVQAGSLRIEALERRSAAGHLFRELVQDGLGKGEAEAVAWAKAQPAERRPLFVSGDRGARKAADDRGVPAGDLMDLVVDAVEAGLLSRADAERLLEPWNDRRQQLGRPRDYSDFADTYARRLAARRAP